MGKDWPGWPGMVAVINLVTAVGTTEVEKMVV